MIHLIVYFSIPEDIDDMPEALEIYHQAQQIGDASLAVLEKHFPKGPILMEIKQFENGSGVPDFLVTAGILDPLDLHTDRVATAGFEISTEMKNIAKRQQKVGFRIIREKGVWGFDVGLRD